MSMPKTDRLSGGIDWIELEFPERERTPEPIIEVVFSCIWYNYHFQIQNSISKR